STVSGCRPWPKRAEPWPSAGTTVTSPNLTVRSFGAVALTGTAAADAAGMSDPPTPPILLDDIDQPTCEPSAGRRLRLQRRPPAALDLPYNPLSTARGVSRAFLCTFI